MPLLFHQKQCLSKHEINNEQFFLTIPDCWSIPHFSVTDVKFLPFPDFLHTLSYEKTKMCLWFVRDTRALYQWEIQTFWCFSIPWWPNTGRSWVSLGYYYHFGAVKELKQFVIRILCTPAPGRR